MTITDTPEVTREQEREAIASVPTGLFIAGEWRTARATMPVDDPSTGEHLVEVTADDGQLPLHGCGHLLHRHATLRVDLDEERTLGVPGLAEGHRHR